MKPGAKYAVSLLGIFLTVWLSVRFLLPLFFPSCWGPDWRWPRSRWCPSSINAMCPGR